VTARDLALALLVLGASACATTRGGPQEGDGAKEVGGPAGGGATRPSDPPLAAATKLLEAQRWDEAAQAAQAIVADPQASEASRAIGARLAATARLGAANAAVKAGQLEKIDLGADGKDGARPPPAGWQRVVDATDAYLARVDADPEARRASAEWPPSGSELALVAAGVRYAYGNVDDARKRLEAVVDRWSSDAELVSRAVPLYLATFLSRGDQAGYGAAIDRVRKRLAAENPSDPARKEALAKQLDALARARASARYAEGEALMRQGKPAQAAGAFVAAAENGATDAPNALHNAAVAWDAAGEAAKAAALRERLVKEHPDAAVTAEDALRLAAFRAREGDHAAAARLYDDFLRRWPLSPSRCVALRNVATELDRSERPAEAAARYLVFGSDPACAKAEPDIAARALVRAGRLFEAQAKAAWSGAAALEGVSDPHAQSDVAEAKRRLKGP
jgi:tetratricopeptide (TPR) repeat protein